MRLRFHGNLNKFRTSCAQLPPPRPVIGQNPRFASFKVTNPYRDSLDSGPNKPLATPLNRCTLTSSHTNSPCSPINQFSLATSDTTRATRFTLLQQTHSVKMVDQGQVQADKCASAVLRRFFVFIYAMVECILWSEYAVQWRCLLGSELCSVGAPSTAYQL